jgi:hypothetical protein
MKLLYSDRPFLPLMLLTATGVGFAGSALVVRDETLVPDLPGEASVVGVPVVTRVGGAVVGRNLHRLGQVADIDDVEVIVVGTGGLDVLALGVDARHGVGGRAGVDAAAQHRDGTIFGLIGGAGSKIMYEAVSVGERAA